MMAPEGDEIGAVQRKVGLSYSVLSFAAEISNNADALLYIVPHCVP